jgi:hypothetical protein
VHDNVSPAAGLRLPRVVDHNRAVRVPGAVLGRGAEQQTGDGVSSARAHHKQVGVCTAAHQHLGCMTVHDDWPARHAGRGQFSGDKFAAPLDELLVGGVSNSSRLLSQYTACTTVRTAPRSLASSAAMRSAWRE